MVKLVVKKVYLRMYREGRKFQVASRIIILLVALVMSVGFRPEPPTAHAQAGVGAWTDFENISNTPWASTYPSMVADQEGNIHVLWSEDAGGRSKNPILNTDGTYQLDTRGLPINLLTDIGNTLYYTRWDGEQWLDPIDIYINPFGQIVFPAASVDPQGMLHAVWIGNAGGNTFLYYSRAPVQQASSARAWTEPEPLVDSVLTAYYSVDIATDQEGGVHILYSHLGNDPGAFVISSTDGGRTWTEPMQLFSTSDEQGQEDGVSTMRLMIDKKDRLHATWTRFDVSGNGREIYYSQSTDLGRTWSKPFMVAAWQRGWYEVDWLSVGVVGDEIHLTWEGSSNVAALNERISEDGGQTWSKAERILPDLVGENGFATLVTDSADNLHLLVVKRTGVRVVVYGVWYSEWINHQWQTPEMLGTNSRNLVATSEQLQNLTSDEVMRGTFSGDGLRYQQATIVNGNKLFVIVVNEFDGDIWSARMNLNTPRIQPQPYLVPTSEPTSTPWQDALAFQTPVPTLPPDLSGDPVELQTSDSQLVWIGLIPSLLLVIGVIGYIAYGKRQR